MTKPISNLDLARAVRARLTPRKAWIKSCFFGKQQPHMPQPINVSSYRSSLADCWCLIGAALQEADLVPSTKPITNLETALAERHGDFLMAFAEAASIPFSPLEEGDPRWILCGIIISWQDKPERTHQEVLDALDHTITILAKQPS